MMYEPNFSTCLHTSEMQKSHLSGFQDVQANLQHMVVFTFTFR